LRITFWSLVIVGSPPAVAGRRDIAPLGDLQPTTFI
jgi:hypothetical protein